MTATAYERILDALRENGATIRVTRPGQAQATCPAHDDTTPSLSITGIEGQALVHCHAGCATIDVLAALELTTADLYDTRRGAEYRYDNGRTVHRKLDKQFPQTNTDRPAELYRLGKVREAVAAGRPVYVVEGEKDVHALESVGAVATCSPMGAGKWHKVDPSPLYGATVLIIGDQDEPGRKHAADVAASLEGKYERVELLAAKVGKDAADHVAAGYGLDEFVHVEQPPDEPATAPTPTPSPVAPIDISECHRAFARWLGAHYDTDVLDVVLSAAAAERLQGDPPWLLIVSGSGAAKTETASALAGAGALITSTITSEGALLSATSTRERSKDATGGLLRKIGGRGVLVIKDMTSILSMDRTARGSVLAALREIYDGKWERNVGVDGGRSLNWTGRIIVIGAVTTAWDSAHTVISSMGDRFILVRLDSASGRAQAGRQAIRNSSSEVQMRAELSAAVAALMAGVDTNPAELSEDDVELLLGLADVVTLTRTAVEVDYRGDVIDAHAPEMPTRFAKQLTMIVRGAMAVGIGRADAFALAVRCARDSMPPLRLAVLHDIRSNGGTSTHAARKRLNRPRSTVDRAIQALHALGLVDVDEVNELHGAGFRTVWQYTLSDLVNIEALDLMGVSRNVGKGALEHREERKEEKEGRARPPNNISGTTPDPVTGISRAGAGWTGRKPGEPLPEAGGDP